MFFREDFHVFDLNSSRPQVFFHMRTRMRAVSTPFARMRVKATEVHVIIHCTVARGESTLFDTFAEQGEIACGAGLKFIFHERLAALQVKLNGRSGRIIPISVTESHQRPT